MPGSRLNLQTVPLTLWPLHECGAGGAGLLLMASSIKFNPDPSIGCLVNRLFSLMLWLQPIVRCLCHPSSQNHSCAKQP